MTYKTRSTKICLALGTIFVLGGAVMSCGGDDDDFGIRDGGATEDNGGTTGGQINTGGTTTTSTIRAGAGGVAITAAGGRSGTRTGNAGSGIFADGGAGCYDANGGGHRGTSTNNCGSGGGLCVTCSTGQSCVNGACTASSTDGGTSTNIGCYDADGGPHRGVSNANCGTGGGTCTTCSTGQSCISGVCTNDDEDAG